ncbi:MAG: hypothetical protein WCP60_10350 [bacterium]
MAFFFNYKTTFAHRLGSLRSYLKKRERRIYAMLDHLEDYFNDAIYYEDDEDDPKLFSWPAKDWVWQKFTALAINADSYRRNYRWDPAIDYEYIARPAEFELETPKEKLWPRNKIDLSTIPPGSAQLVTHQWIHIDAIETRAIDANDRWMYQVKHKKKLRYAPGEWMYFNRKELGRIYPSMSIATHEIRNRNVFLMHVLRDPMGIPTELWVYSSNYKPLFKSTMVFKDPNYVPHPPRRGSWWHNNKHNWTFHELLLKEEKENPTETNDIQNAFKGIEMVVPRN